MGTSRQGADMDLVRYRRCSSLWGVASVLFPRSQVNVGWPLPGSMTEAVNMTFILAKIAIAARALSPSSHGTMAHPDSVPAPLPDCMHRSARYLVCYLLVDCGHPLALRI